MIVALWAREFESKLRKWGGTGGTSFENAGGKQVKERKEFRGEWHERSGETPADRGRSRRVCNEQWEIRKEEKFQK